MCKLPAQNIYQRRNNKDIKDEKRFKEKLEHGKFKKDNTST